MILFRSALFTLWFALMSIVLCVTFLPTLFFPVTSRWLARTWCHWTLWGLKVFGGVGMEVRGLPPNGAVLVASKHMSMWDTVALYVVLDRPAIVLKRELLSIPFYGWYVRRAAAIPIDRDGKASAMRKMTNAGKAVLAQGRPILIFPEGTRKKPGAEPDYKPGVAGLYGLLNVPCIPVALNSGLHWPGFRKIPGTIIVEFLPAIPAGLRRPEFMTILADRIETATNKLLAG